jgi:hypothetical protein
VVDVVHAVEKADAAAGVRPAASGAARP